MDRINLRTSQTGWQNAELWGLDRIEHVHFPVFNLIDLYTIIKKKRKQIEDQAEFLRKQNNFEGKDDIQKQLHTHAKWKLIELDVLDDIEKIIFLYLIF